LTRGRRATNCRENVLVQFPKKSAPAPFFWAQSERRKTEAAWQALPPDM